mmetsp:Transcript_74075/g.217372  ORF Transcript_74075/g.217372 Transcript_74075/m.217372 type:complete len:332 (+) Transcript_74075:392-1387(+)
MTWRSSGGVSLPSASASAEATAFEMCSSVASLNHCCIFQDKLFSSGPSMAWLPFTSKLLKRPTSLRHMFANGDLSFACCSSLTNSCGLSLPSELSSTVPTSFRPAEPSSQKDFWRLVMTESSSLPSRRQFASLSSCLKKTIIFQGPTPAKGEPPQAFQRSCLKARRSSLTRLPLGDFARMVLRYDGASLNSSWSTVDTSSSSDPSRDSDSSTSSFLKSPASDQGKAKSWAAFRRCFSSAGPRFPSASASASPRSFAKSSGARWAHASCSANTKAPVPSSLLERAPSRSLSAALKTKITPANCFTSSKFNLPPLLIPACAYSWSYPSAVSLQ